MYDPVIHLVPTRNIEEPIEAYDPIIRLVQSDQKYKLALTSPTATGTKDYEALENKPKINNVELIGNMLLADLFPDGIIINGGNADGYETIQASTDALNT